MAAMMDSNMDINHTEMGWESARPNRKGTLRFNPFAKQYKKGGVIEVDRVSFSLNKKKRWSMVDDYAEAVENGRSDVRLTQRKSRRRTWAQSVAADNVNELVLSVGRQDNSDAEEESQEVDSAPKGFKIITTRKGRCVVQLREKGKRVAGKHEGSRAKLEASKEPMGGEIAVHPCMAPGTFPLKDGQGRMTRSWKKGVRGAERNGKKNPALPKNFRFVASVVDD
jgi:hypothetical protein